MYGKNVRVNLFTQAAGFNWLIRILWVADTPTPGSNNGSYAEEWLEEKPALHKYQKRMTGAEEY